MKYCESAGGSHSADSEKRGGRETLEPSRDGQLEGEKKPKQYEDPRETHLPQKELLKPLYQAGGSQQARSAPARCPNNKAQQRSGSRIGSPCVAPGISI